MRGGDKKFTINVGQTGAAKNLEQEHLERVIGGKLGRKNEKKKN